MSEFFFLFKAEWYHIACVYHILFIYSSINGHLDSFHPCAIVNNTALNMGLQLFVPVLLLLLGVFPELKFLDHMVMLCLMFLAIAILFFTVSAPSCIPASNAQRLQFLHTLANTYFPLFKHHPNEY